MAQGVAESTSASSCKFSALVPWQDALVVRGFPCSSLGIAAVRKGRSALVE